MLSRTEKLQNLSVAAVLTMIYLAASFLTEEWNRTWIIWVVSGVLYAAVMSVCRLVAESKK